MSRASEILRLVAVLALAALFLRRVARRPAAERRPWKDLACLAAFALAGALFGASVAAVTVRLAPEYYRVVKGVPPGPAFLGRAMLVGGRAGFGAFGVGAAVLLLAAPAGTRLRAIVRVAPIPILGALALGILTAAIRNLGVPFPGPSVAVPLHPEQARVVAIAWIAHVGLYLGGLLGLVAAALRLRGAERDP